MDFLLENSSEVVPVEVKSGKDYARHLALNNLLADSHYSMFHAVVLCNDNLSAKGAILYAPIYMLMFMEHRSSTEPQIYKMDLSALR